LFTFGYHSGKELVKPRAKANKTNGPTPAGGSVMGYHRRTIQAVAVTLIVSAAALSSASASAHHRRLLHPPIHVATPTGGSPITPYVFTYGSRYRYNSPGPVYGQLDYWSPVNGCRLWRYNYLYWVC
jgi:hypothetical protein